MGWGGQCNSSAGRRTISLNFYSVLCAERAGSNHRATAMPQEVNNENSY